MAIQIWQPGAKIKNDRFHILKQLGKGGFGITYLAEDTVKKQQIVIKTLNANQQGEADFAQKQENFVKEGFTLRTFNHPHIVKVYEPIDFDGLWGLVMEYIPGQDLADYIIANGRLGEAEALNYIDQIAQALDCVHQQKFFHRDVKPHNIMLRQDRSEAVLIDFGIAKEFVDLETIYLSNSLGTELYKPIEQYEKRGQFGAYTDIYALAVTLYHLLTGAAPGGGSPLYTSKARKDAQDKGWGDKLDEHLWGELAKAGVSDRSKAAIKAGMEIDPSQRPQTMTEFRQLLQSVVEQVRIEDELDINQNWFEQAVELEKLGRYEEAIDSHDRALKINPEDFDVWRNRGLSLLRLGRHEEALESYGHALELNPNNPSNWCQCGYSLDKLSRNQEAILCLEHATMYDQDDYYNWYFRGYLLYKSDRYKEAINCCNRALEINPESLFSWRCRGLSLRKLGKYEEALESYSRVFIEPGNFDTWKCPEFSIYELDRHQEVIDKYNPTFEIWTEIHFSIRNLGSSLEKIGRYEEAINVYDGDLKMNPSDTSLWIKKGDALAKIEQYEQAVNNYNRALEINPNNYEAPEKLQILIKKFSRHSATK
jgi:serine/threonine protein kinase/ribosomal protein S16